MVRLKIKFITKLCFMKTIGTSTKTCKLVPTFHEEEHVRDVIQKLTADIILKFSLGSHEKTPLA